MGSAFLHNTFYKMLVKEGASERLSLLYPYNIDIELDDGTKIEIGRFSSSAVTRISVFHASVGPHPHLKIGSFCEFSRESVIVVGGDHDNDSLFNLTLTSRGGVFRAQMTEDDRRLIRPVARQTVIEDGVVVSIRATIMQGVKIGTGAVIGAGALVVSDCPAFGVCIGTPAKSHRERLSPEHQAMYRDLQLSRVASHVVPLIPRVAHDYQAGKIDALEMRRRLPLIDGTGTIVMKGAISPKGSIGPLSVHDFRVNGQSVESESKRKTLTNYFNQLHSSDDAIQWSPDIFVATGLCKIVR